jgi:hypothetical protein
MTGHGPAIYAPVPDSDSDDYRPGHYDVENTDAQELAEHEAATAAHERAATGPRTLRPERHYSPVPQLGEITSSSSEIASSSEESSGSEESRTRPTTPPAYDDADPATFGKLMQDMSKFDAEDRVRAERRRIRRLKRVAEPARAELANEDDEESSGAERRDERRRRNKFIDNGAPEERQKKRRKKK